MKSIGDLIPTPGSRPVSGRPPAPPQPPQPPLTVRHATRLAGQLITPLSPKLRDALEARDRGQGRGSYGPITPDLRHELQQRLRATSPLMEGADISLVGEWLTYLAELSEAAPKGDSLVGAITALAPNLQLPVACFTEGTLMAAVRVMGGPPEEGGSRGFFPGFARLEAVLLPFARTTASQITYLQKILDRAEAPPPKEAPMDDEYSEEAVVLRLRTYAEAPRDQWTRKGIDAFQRQLKLRAPALEERYRKSFEALLIPPEQIETPASPPPASSYLQDHPNTEALAQARLEAAKRRR